MTEKFDGVSVIPKANVYFDGKVVSHTVLFKDGSRKTLGLVYAGTYKFDTAGPETMELSSGSCRVRLNGGDWKDYQAGESFAVPGQSSFEITVEQGLAQYICSYG